MGDRAGQTCERSHTQHRCFSHLDDAWRAEFGDDVELPCWANLLKSRIAIFDLDFDVILSAMYALSVSAEGDCYRCVLPYPGIAAAALGASASGTLPGTAPIEALHTFTLDSGASRCFFRDSTTLTPLPAPVPVTLADPSGGTGTDSLLHYPPVYGSSIRFTVRPSPPLILYELGSSLYILATEPSHVAASAQMSASGQVAASFSCRRLTHQTLLWHHRLGHPSLPHLRGMQSHLLVSGLPRSLPPLPPSPAPPCLPCVEGWQRAAPHSSSFPPTTSPLQTLHMDVWGPARVNGQSRECYFLLVVDDYTRYTTVFPLHSKGEIADVLIPWIREVRLQLRERFGQDLPVLHLHSDRGGEISSNLLRDFCRGEGILQTFTLPDSPQQNGIAERHIGLVMEVARTSMIHMASPHFLWPFAVRYSAHQLNLWPRVSLSETSPTVRWTGEVGNTSVFRFYHPTLCCVFPSQDAMFDESVPFYRLVPYRSAPPPPLPLFLAPDPPPVDPLPPQGPAPSGAPQGAAFGGVASGGAESGGAESGSAESEGAETGGAEPWGVATGGGELGGAELEGVEPGGVASEGAESGGAEPQGAASSGGSAGASSRLSPQQLLAAGAGVTGGTATTGPGGARTRGTRAAGTGGVEGAGAGDLRSLVLLALVSQELEELELEALVQEALELEALVLEVLELEELKLLTLVSQPPLQPASPLPAPSPYTEQSSGLTERREPASRPVSPVRTARQVPHLRPPLVPGTHAMTLRPSFVPLRVPLPAPPDSSLPEVLDHESNCARAASPTVSRLLATSVTDPSLESIVAFPLIAELLDFAAACRLDYATALIVESASASPPSIGGECALGTDVLEDKQEDFECLAAAVITGPHSSQWRAAMDAEMASWKSTGTYVDEVPPLGENIVDGMWIFRVKRPPGSPPAFKARYVARGFSQRQGVDYFQTVSPTSKMTTLSGSLHEEIWLRRPPGFTESFPACTQWSLWRPVYGLRQAPREWHDTLRATLAALGFAPTTNPPFYVLVYVDDLVFAIADPEALTLVKSELQKRHTCTDLGALCSYLGLQITWDRVRRTITLTQSHMVHPVLQRRGFQFSSPQPTPLSTSHSFSAPPSDESVEPSGPYPELVGCLMYLMMCTRLDLMYPLSLLARYVAPSRHRKVHWDAAKRVLRYLCSTSGMGLVLGGRGPIILTGHANSSWVDNSAT
ncbi:unnamed protein product [Closterium sp. NIES-53]